MNELTERIVSGAVGPVLSALLAVFVVNAFSRRWQNRQKALEIKAGLVSDLSEAVMELVVAVRSAHRNQQDQNRDAMKEASRVWETRSAVIGTKLEAYLQETPIPTEWDRFSDLLDDFYALEEAPLDEKPDRQKHLYTDAGGAADAFASDWDVLTDLLLQKKRAIIQSILRTKMLSIGPA